MRFFFLYCFLSMSGEKLYASQEAHINWRPIKKYEMCIKEAKKIEKRINLDLQNTDGYHLFQNVEVTCEKGKKKCELLTK